MVQVEVLENYDAICKRAAGIIVDAIRAHGGLVFRTRIEADEVLCYSPFEDKKRPFVLGLATGSTPIGVYKVRIKVT